MDRLETMSMFDNGLSSYNGVKVLSVYCHMNGRGPQRVRELNFDEVQCLRELQYEVCVAGLWKQDHNTVEYVGDTFKHLEHMNSSKTGVDEFDSQPLNAFGRGLGKDEYQAEIKWKSSPRPIERVPTPPPVKQPQPQPPKVWKRPELHVQVEDKKKEEPWVRPPHRTFMLSPKLPTSAPDFNHYQLPSPLPSPQPRAEKYEIHEKYENDMLLTAYYMADGDKPPVPPKKKNIHHFIKQEF